jgi:Ca-activated chloride channel homolog
MGLLFWLIPLLIFFVVYAAYKRKNALAVFADSIILQKINTAVHRGRRNWKIIMILLSVALINIALLRPGWNPEPQLIESVGRDVVFVIDVSKSMLAEDLAPNRLGKAKLAVLDTVERLEGDRVALVAFAGTAAVQCPLTLDYNFFRSRVENLSVDTISRGGTLMGDAIRKVLDEVYTDEEKKFKDIILITDGEDHDSFPLQAAEEAGARGTRLIAIGFGDENTGQRIPVTDQLGRKNYLTYEGQEIWSRLDADSLRKMANATPGGRYINVSTGTIDLGEIYTKLITGAEKREIESKTIERYDEKYQTFLLAALILLAAELLISERKRKKT